MQNLSGDSNCIGPDSRGRRRRHITHIQSKAEWWSSKRTSCREELEAKGSIYDSKPSRSRQVGRPHRRRRPTLDVDSSPLNVVSSGAGAAKKATIKKARQHDLPLTVQEQKSTRLQEGLNRTLPFQYLIPGWEMATRQRGLP